MKVGDKVYWKNDPSQQRWTILRWPAESQFAYIVDNPKLYPKTDSHSVPKGTLSETPFHEAQVPAETAREAEGAPEPRPASSSPRTTPPRPGVLYPDRYVRPEPTAAPKRAPKPAIKVPGGLDLNGLKAFAASVGLGSHHMEHIHRIWDTPAPNKPMRTMRVHNYIKNEYQKVDVERVTESMEE